MSEPRTWTLWAHDYGTDAKLPGRLFMHIGAKGYVRIHGLPEPMEVEVTEDPEGPYHGWLETGEDTPSMIWPSQAQRDMCFAYGPKTEEDRGRGKMMRFTITAKEAGRKDEAKPKTSP